MNLISVNRSVSMIWFDLHFRANIYEFFDCTEIEMIRQAKKCIISPSNEFNPNLKFSRKKKLRVFSNSTRSVLPSVSFHRWLRFDKQLQTIDKPHLISCKLHNCPCRIVRQSVKDVLWCVDKKDENIRPLEYNKSIHKILVKIVERPERKKIRKFMRVRICFSSSDFIWEFNRV